MDECVLQVLELYSGIGGMHTALNLSGLPFKVRLAIDINTNANLIYKRNFPDTNLKQANIESVSITDYDALNVDTILMSPPCQPFTRVGQKLDISDPRCKSLLYVINILDSCKVKPSYVLVENVAQFELSQARELLTGVLHKHNYHIQEFLISPVQLGIPNSRLRYFLLARLGRTFQRIGAAEGDTSWKCRLCQILLPYHLLAATNTMKDTETGEAKKYSHTMGTGSEELRAPPPPPLLHCVRYEPGGAGGHVGHNCHCSGMRTVDHYITEDSVGSATSVSDSLVRKYGRVLDIVNRHSTRSCCFTKAYGKYVEGTGSVLQTANVTTECVEAVNSMKLVEGGGCELTDHLLTLGLRYFTPPEIARLMAFPQHFTMSDVGLTTRQHYQLLGNSLNCYVVSILLRILTS